MAPNKKKKNPQRNAYYFYMLDFKTKKEAEGMKFPGGLKDVAEAASASWKGLDPKSKQYYEKMAERAKVAGSRGVRYNTQGQTYEEAERQRNEVELQRQKMLNEIEYSVKRAGREGLKYSSFYFIHINHFGAMENTHFIPCEVAVLCYTIEQGFQRENIFHEFIRNLDLPTGYTFKAKAHSEATHKCPLPPDALGTCLVNKIRDKIWNLMERNGDMVDGVPPPLYTMSNFLPECVDFFTFMYDSYESVIRGVDNGTTAFRVYPIEELFFAMKNFGLKPEGQHLFVNGIEDKGFQYLSTAQDILRDDVYEYAPDIACEFHEEQDVRQHCSRSYVIRWGYLFSDYLCRNLDVEIKHVSHTPRGIDLSAKQVTSQMSQMELEESQEGPMGHGRAWTARDMPMPLAHSMIGNSYGRGAATCLPSTSGILYQKPVDTVDYSQFEDESDDDDDDEYDVEMPTKSHVEDAPLRQPKTQVKSSMMLDKMFPPLGSTSNIRPNYTSAIAGLTVGRGRARGCLVLPSGKVIPRPM